VEEAVQGLPSLAVGLEGGEILGIEWGLRHDLSPVDTSQVTGILGSDETVGGEDVEPTVVIEIGEGGAPGPAGHGGAGFHTDVFESTLAIGGEEGVATGHALEGGEGLGVGTGYELFLVGDAVSGAGEHVADVKIHPAVAIKIAPVGGHAGRGIFDAKLEGDIDEEGELAVLLWPLVLVEAVASEVIGDVEVEVAVLIIILPGGGEGKAGVVLVESGLGGDVSEGPVAIVSPNDVGASVVGIVERDGLA